MIFEVARWLSILAFLFYGLACLFSDSLIEEFRRYGLEKFRTIVGIAETAGALGLLLGIEFQLMTFLAATGLCALMASGTVVRVAVKDPLPQTLPAFSLFLLNFYLAVSTFC